MGVLAEKVLSQLPSIERKHYVHFTYLPPPEQLTTEKSPGKASLPLWLILLIIGEPVGAARGT